MSLDIVIAFFTLGVFASLLKSNLTIPTGLYQSLAILLMLAIGLKGGIALTQSDNSGIFVQSLFVVSLGLILPLIAFPILKHIGGFSRIDSASIAAHYGSVSVGTYAVAVAVLEAKNINYEPYFPLFVVLLEAPAIAVGLVLADKSALKKSKKLFKEIIASEGIILLTGGLIIGYLFSTQTQKVMPLFGDLFHGLLALFLLHMGIVTGSKLKLVKENGVFLLSFGIFMPLVGAFIGACLAILAGLSMGGVILLSVLGASASYIAVPAAMALALPKANPSFSMTLSLAVTFPFNVIVGIPLYIGVAQWVLA